MKKQDFILVALLGLTILLFSRYLLTWPTPLIFPAPDVSYGTDLVRESWSIFRYTSDVFHQTSRFPLWRPYLLSGAPLIGHPVAPVMYPPNWLTLILPLPLAFNLLIIFHLWWAGVGTYLYLRLRAGISPEAAFIGAIIFAHSPRLFTHIGGGHLPLIAAISWWPWAWFAFSQYWYSQQNRWAVLLGLALAAHALNDGRYAAMTGVCLAAVTAWKIGHGKLPALRRSVALWLVAGLVAAGVAAIEVGPFVDLLPYSNRTTLTESETLGGLEPAFLMNVLFRSSVVEPESYTFVGITVIVLVLLGGSAEFYSEKRWAFALLITIVLSLGTNIPLTIYPLLVRYVPIFQFFRAPGRWYPYAIFAAAMLAAWGYEKWRRGVKSRPWLRPALLTLSLVYLGVSFSAVLIPLNLPFRYFPQAFLLPVASFLVTQEPTKWQHTRIILIVLIILDLWVVDTELIAPQSEQALVNPDPSVRYLISSLADGERVFAPYGHLAETAPVAFNLHTADGYDSFMIKTYDDFMRRATHCDYPNFVVGAPPMRADAVAAQECSPFAPNMNLLRLLNIHYLLLPKPMDIPDSMLVFHEQDHWIYDIGHGYGRAFGATQIEIADPETCMEKLVRLNDPAHQAILEDSGLGKMENSSLTVLSHRFVTNGEEFQVNGAGLLVRSEVWAPGWTVTIDNGPAPVKRVDCTLQGVWLPEGTHTVRFAYLPRLFPISLIITCSAYTGLGLYAIWLLVGYLRSRTSSP